jgi:hypothetical protein
MLPAKSLIFILLLLFGCKRENTSANVDFIGKTKRDVLLSLVSQERISNPHTGKLSIMIGAGPAYLYFDDLSDIMKDNKVMNATKIDVCFNKKMTGIKKGLSFYRLSFNNKNIVVNQEKMTVSDAF